MLYPLKVVLVFSVLYLLYIVFLDRLTFHKLNRLILLLILPVSVIIPFSNNLFPTVTSKIIDIPLFQHTNLATVGRQLQVIENPLQAFDFNYSLVLISIYWLVFSICLIRILGTVRKLAILKRKSKI